MNRHDLRRIASISGISAASLVAAIAQAEGAPPRELIYPERPNLILPDNALTREERGLLQKLAIIPGIGFVPAFGGGGSEITLVSFASGVDAANNASTVSISKPAGVIAGDLLIAMLGCNQDTSWNTLSGWTEVADQGARPNLGVQYKIAGGSEPSSYTFQQSGSFAGQGGVIVAYRSAAFDTIGTIASGANGDPLSASAITSASGILLCPCFSASPSITFTTPSGMTSFTSQNASGISWNIFAQPVGAGSTGARGTTPSGGRAACILIGIKAG